MWQSKAAVQFILAQVPGGEDLNYRLQELKGSYSDGHHLKELVAQSSRAAALAERFPIAGATVVEIGTGWPGTGALTLYCLGAERIFTYDHMRHLRPNLIGRMIEVAIKNSDVLADSFRVSEVLLLERLGRLRGAKNLDELLSLMGVDYRAPADASRTGLPDGSVDLVYSYAVLAHIPPTVIADIMKESRRVLRPGGRAFHRIGMQDPFTGVGGRSSVGFLRHSDRSWDFWINKGFSANNRVREPGYAEIFAESGATVVWKRTWIDAKAVDEARAMKVDKRFAGIDPEVLATVTMEVDLMWDEPGELA